MKGKKMTYLLVACVAAVWGIIFFKVYSGLGTDEDKPVTNVLRGKTDYFNLAEHRNDRFDKEQNYPDPFAAETASPVVQINTAPRNPGVVKSAPMAIKPAVNWSAVRYSGYISNPVTRQKVVILYINGKEAMLSEGQSAEGLKLMHFAGDSVKVLYQQNIKYISIK